MKYFLTEISEKLDREVGRLSPIVATDKVIRNRIARAVESGRMPHLSAQKRRTFESWVKVLHAADILVPKKKAA